jgi:predicted amidohydrolase
MVTSGNSPRWQTDPVHVSLIQFAATLDVEHNLETVRRLAHGAYRALDGREEERLVVLPEAAMHDFGPPDLPLGRVAQPLDGAYVEALARLACEVGATVVSGMFEQSGDANRPYNTLVVLSPAGELVAHYRKTYLYDSFGYRESDRLTPGDGEPVVVPLGGLNLGLLTCYDVRFPELGRELVDAGADTLVVPAAWVRGPLKEDHWVTLLRARAIENTTYVLAAGQCGTHYIGSSMVVDPMGVIVAAAGVGEAVASAGIERQMVDDVRRSNPSLANRRRRAPR